MPKWLVLFFPHLRSATRFVGAWVARFVVCGCCVGLFGFHIWVLRFLIVCIMCSWLGYLDGEISVFFFLSFQLAASFLVELETIVMVVVPWVLFLWLWVDFLG